MRREKNSSFKHLFIFILQLESLEGGKEFEDHKKREKETSFIMIRSVVRTREIEKIEKKVGGFSFAGDYLN